MGRTTDHPTSVEKLPSINRQTSFKWKNIRKFFIEVVAVLTTIIVFGVPLYFVFVNAAKTTKEASLLNMSWPSSFELIDNVRDVMAAENGMIYRAFMNSSLITLFSIIILIICGAMAGYVLHRRKSKLTPFFNFLVLTGLIIPPAIVPTIWVLNGIGLFKTMLGIVLVQVALRLPFTVLLYRGFMATIPKQIDEAALIDGCSKFKLFTSIIMPLLKPVTATIIVLNSVQIYNDFVNFLYFYPGAQNATLQLTLYNFMSLFNTQWNLLFTNVLLISIPPLILFIFFSKRIIAGMVAGAIK